MIQYPKLKKIGGLQNFLKNGLFRILIILAIATLVGYLGGHTLQKNYRNMTGYLPEGEAVVEIQEVKNTETGGVYKKVQGFIETTKDSSVALVYKAINPPLRAMDWAAFWFSFTLCFIVAGWLSNKLINFEKQVIQGGADPTVIKNIQILEAKVKELVDHANKN